LLAFDYIAIHQFSYAKMTTERCLQLELRATAILNAPRHKPLQDILLAGFHATSPSCIKLWELACPGPGSFTEPGITEDTLKHIIFLLTIQVSATKQQTEAIHKAFDAPAGLTLIHGGSESITTTTMMLHALTAVATGHKVLISAPDTGKSAILQMFGASMPVLPNMKVPKTYLANSAFGYDISFLVFELARAQHESDDMPVVFPFHVGSLCMLIFLSTP